MRFRLSIPVIAASLIINATGVAFAVTNSIPCDYLSISNACAIAKEGDVVVIQPGSCVITEAIQIDRKVSFTIAGSGTNHTTLISGPGLRQVFFLFSNSSNVFTVRDLNCVGNIANSSGFFVAGYGGRANPGPYHFYNIQMTNVAYRGISIGRGGAYGLIDHCYFKTVSGSSQPIDFQGDGYTSFTSPNPLGTIKVACVEDCYFDNGKNYGNGFFDAYNGAQLVWRHNFCNGNAPSGGHGADSSPVSFRTAEVYNNVFTNGGGALALQWRGGVSMVFSNSCFGFSDFTQLAYYRSCIAHHCYIFLHGQGVPGQPFIWSFAKNPTNGQQLILTNCNGQAFDQNYRFVSPSVKIAGDVLIGANLSETVSNLYNAVNLGPGAGIRYAASTPLNPVYKAVSISPTSISLLNVLDSNTDTFGYPANQQPGVLTSFPRTGIDFVNRQVVFPCYSWSNTLNGINTGFNLQDNSAACNYYITNLVKLGRDYFNDKIPAPETYTPLVYPHPLQALKNSGSMTTVQRPFNVKVVPGP